MNQFNYEEMKNFLISHKNIVLVITSIVVFLILMISIVFVLFTQKKVHNTSLSSYSQSQINPGRAYFTLNTQSGYLYKSNKEGIEAVKDFIKNGGPVNGKAMLPLKFSDNSALSRVSKDSELNSQYMTNSSSKEHYFFNQSLNTIPVHGATLVVHLQNKNEIYSVSGNIDTNNNVESQNIPEQQALEFALATAKKEVANSNPVSVVKSQKTILNFKVLGLSDDMTNYVTLAVQVNSSNYGLSKIYYVDLSSGKIIYTEDLLFNVEDRRVYNCSSTSDPRNCPLTRSEGAPPTGNSDADGLYGIMDEVYQYYFNTFGRDGLDGAGGPIEGFVNIYSWSVGSRTIPCTTQKNAYNTGVYMGYCNGTVARDITAHEFTHGVVAATASLASGYQYGAMNESIADSFANAIDGNWTMGEGSFLGVIRSMSDPTSVRDSSGPQPDKVFSSYYDCASEEVHHNDGVPNKAFYLMTDGGSFNGCDVTGLGTIKSHAILYKALVQYLQPTSNFYDLYTAINQACADLYGTSSSECIEAKKAYEATEMDQQTPGSARGAMCTGAIEKTATCAGLPTSAPISSVPTPTSTLTPTPTLRPGETPTSTPKPTSSSQPTATPTPIGGGYQQNGTPTPTPDQYFTCKPDPACVASGKSIQLCPLKCDPVP